MLGATWTDLEADTDPAVQTVCRHHAGRIPKDFRRYAKSGCKSQGGCA